MTATNLPAKSGAPLPQPGLPLKQTFNELSARADGGDADAASRLFQDTQRCQRFRQLSQIVPQTARRLLNEKIEGATAQELKSTDAFLGMTQKQLAFLRDNASLCEDAPQAALDSSLPFALQAAQLGDTTAANCYVGGGGTFGIPAGLVDHPEWLSEYKQNTLALTDDAIEKGDWTMVSQLAMAYEGRVPSLLGQVTGTDQAMAYRYLVLGRLGTQSSDKDKSISFLDSRLKAMSETLQPDQKLAAETWAQNAFEHYFVNNPQNPAYNSFTVCPSGGP